MSKVQGGGGPIDFGSIRPQDGVQSKEVQKKELGTKGTNEISRTQIKTKAEALINRGVTYLRGLWSNSSSSKAVNTKMAGLASQAMKPPPNAEKSTEQSEIQQDVAKTVSERPAARPRPGPGIRPQNTARSNYNAMTPEAGKSQAARPRPGPGIRPGGMERRNYNAMTPEAMKKALESEDALSDHVDNAINEMLIEDDLPPPADMPPTPPSDLPSTLTQKLQNAMRDFNIKPRGSEEPDDWDEKVEDDLPPPTDMPPTPPSDLPQTLTQKLQNAMRDFNVTPKESGEVDDWDEPDVKNEDKKVKE